MALDMATEVTQLDNTQCDNFRKEDGIDLRNQSAVGF